MTDLPPIASLAVEKSTHAPVFERYLRGSFETIGDPPERGKPWRQDPETGAEIHALGGPDHQYSTDNEVGSSYPETTFFFGKGPDGTLSHDDLEAALRELGLWSDALNPIAVPRTADDGSVAYRYGFQFRPPERQPYSLDGIKDTLREWGDDVITGRNGVNAINTSV